MATIPISDAKARLPMLVREVAATGQGYVISVNGRPMAELRPFQPEPVPGRFAGRIRIDDGALDPLTPADADAWGV
ncbi:MAG: type II toxin-antitoxin system prevent-host-death family antitoxin [Gemmatimonadetes bacterium]|nr:type II toxin-antitoxin system prevent-host-death family antitoxin [Gemmatimonadota bacterium]